MEDKTILWIFGTGIGLVILIMGYFVYEHRDLRKRFHTKNNDLTVLLTQIQINATEVFTMVRANEKVQDDIKRGVEGMKTTMDHLSNELSRISGHLSKGK